MRTFTALVASGSSECGPLRAASENSEMLLCTVCLQYLAAFAQSEMLLFTVFAASENAEMLLVTVFEASDNADMLLFVIF